ncbi:MAG: hypothetical protein M3530_06175, partial [Thermoproteota archaeon]|nr:hypothetical protein [Thermoproteota archaeon]
NTINQFGLLAISGYTAKKLLYLQLAAGFFNQNSPLSSHITYKRALNYTFYVTLNVFNEF